MKKILIDAKYPLEIRAALVDQHNQIEEIEFQAADKEQIKANIYLAKVYRIEPSLQAVFITYEDGKSGFLPFCEIHPDFFNINETKLQSLREMSLPFDEKDSQKDPIQNSNSSASAAEQNLFAHDEKLLEKPLKDTEAEDIKVSFTSLEDEIIDVKTQYENIHRKYKVQDVIKRGQILLVQAQKEQRGNKAASFTTFLSLAGKFYYIQRSSL